MVQNLTPTIPQAVQAVHHHPAHYVAFDLNAAGAELLNFEIALYGWAIRNVSSSTLATADLYDGTSATGTLIIPINLAANETSREWFGPAGLLLRNGLYLNVTAQEIKGAIFYRRHWPA